MKKGFRTFLKNWYKFERYFWTKKSFIGPLYELHKEIGTPARDKYLGYANHCKTVQEVNGKNRIAFQQRQEYLDRVGKEKAVEIGKKVQQLLDDNDLGQEWMPTLLDYLISGWLCPPIFNLSIDEKGIEGRMRVILELNPDTSLEDIEEAWNVIKEKQRQGWPKYKKLKSPDRRTLENLMLYKKSIEFERKGLKGRKMIWRLFPEPGYMPSDEGKIRDKRRQNRLKTIRHRLKK